MYQYLPLNKHPTIMLGGMSVPAVMIAIGVYLESARGKRRQSPAKLLQPVDEIVDRRGTYTAWEPDGRY